MLTWFLHSKAWFPLATLLLFSVARAGARLRWAGVRAQPVRRALCLITHTGHA